MAFLFLCLYTVFLIFRPQDWYAPLHGAPLMLIFLGMAFLLTVIRKDFRYKDMPTLALFALVLVMMASTVFNGWAGGVVKIARDFAPIVMTYLIYANLLTDPVRLRRLCLCIVACTSLMAWHSIGQRETGIGWTGARTVEGNRVTWVGIFNDPNDLGLMLLVAVPMVIMLMRQARSRLTQLMYLSLAALHVYGVFLTRSRGAMLTLGLLLAVAGYRRYGLAKSIAAFVLALPAVVVVVSGMRAVDAEEESAAGRIEAWYTGIQLFKDNPFFGVGMNNFTEYHHLTAHNSYILVLAELGVFGYIAWLLMISAAGVMAWHGLNATLRDTSAGSRPAPPGDFQPPVRGKPKAPLTRVEGAMVLYSLMAYLAAAFFLSRSYIIVLYMICGLAVAYYHRVVPEAAAIGRVNGRQLTAFVVGFVPLSLIALYVIVRVLL